MEVRSDDGLNLDAFGDRFGVMLRSMENCFYKLNPDVESGDEFHAILAAVEQFDDPAVTDPNDIVQSILSEETGAEAREIIFKSPMGPLLLSVVFCVRAMYASREDSGDRAWACMTDAYYWGGIAYWSIQNYKQLGQAARLALRKHSSSGGKGKASIQEPLRQFVYELVRDRVLNGGKKWPSIRNAAMTIESKYLEKAAELEIRVSKGNAVRRITELIGEMPDTSEFINIRVKEAKSE